MAMRKPIFGALVMMAMACAVRAQDVNLSDNSARDSGTTAASFGGSPVAQVNLSAAAGDAVRSFALATPAPGSSSASAAPADPGAAPAARPKYVFGERDDYRWQLALGVEFFRFQSNILNASMVGLNTTVSYYTNDWFALEGNLVTGFAPQIYDREHVKYFGGGGGIRIGTRKARFEPWGHALVGGGRLQPQTAGHGRGALTAQAGIGLDYRVHARLSLRAEADYVYSAFFGQTQNNFQGVAAVVFHF
ncbi:MAG TPA: hypothetical protein VGF61_20710 [Candidatus Acidoferrum sp.]|jgi:hypothetical protein